MNVKAKLILGSIVFIVALCYFILKPHQDTSIRDYENKLSNNHAGSSQDAMGKSATSSKRSVANFSNHNDKSYTKKPIDPSLAYACKIDSGNSFTSEALKQSGLDPKQWREATTILREALQRSRNLVVANATLISKKEDEIEILVGKSNDEGDAIVQELYSKLSNIGGHQASDFLTSIFDHSVLNFNHGRIDGRIVAYMTDGMLGAKKISKCKITYIDPENGSVMRTEEISDERFVTNYGREVQDLLLSHAK